GTGAAPARSERRRGKDPEQGLRAEQRVSPPGTASPCLDGSRPRRSRGQPLRGTLRLRFLASFAGRALAARGGLGGKAAGRPPIAAGSWGSLAEQIARILHGPGVAAT